MATLNTKEQRAREPSHIPASTYRFQFHKDFTLAKAQELIDYLSELGVTDVYSSPLLKARPGSTHGYDCVDHNKINDEIGTLEQFNKFSSSLKEKGWI